MGSLGGNRKTQLNTFAFPMMTAKKRRRTWAPRTFLTSHHPLGFPITEGPIELVPPNALRGHPHLKIDGAQRGKQGAYSQTRIIQASGLRRSPSTPKEQCGHLRIHPFPRTTPGETLWNRTESRQASPALAGLGREATLTKHEARRTSTAAGHTLEILGTVWAYRPPSAAPCRPSGVANSLACAGVPSFPWALATPLAGTCAAAATPETRHCQRRDEVPVRACSRENGQRERRGLSSAGELQGRGGVCV